MTDRVPLNLDHGAKGLEVIEAAIAKEPDNRSYKEARHWILLSLGRLAEGWPEYKWHLHEGSQVNYDTYPVPRWDGSDLTDKHVLVWTDHGIGDQVFAAGMFNDLINLAGSVTIMCNRRLALAFRRSLPKAAVYMVGDPIPKRLNDWAFDFQLSWADVGAAVRPTLDFKQPAYLKADPAKTARLRAKYRQDGRPLVGISWWSQNAVHVGKSMRLESLASILRNKSVQFVNLQYGDNSAELAQARNDHRVDIIHDDSFNQLTDMESYIAQVAAMDYVVTTSNTTAHIAGALGVPGILILPRGTTGRFWYWHNDRSDSPWYPSLHLIRQFTPGDWAVPITLAHLELMKLIECHARKLTA